MFTFCAPNGNYNLILQNRRDVVLLDGGEAVLCIHLEHDGTRVSAASHLVARDGRQACGSSLIQCLFDNTFDRFQTQAEVEVHT